MTTNHSVLLFLTYQNKSIPRVFFRFCTKIIFSFFFSPNVEVWIGAFLHTSTNESMDSLCKPFNIDLVPDQSQKRDDILCIYFDISTMKFHTERCENKKKFFFCHNFKKGKNILSPSLFYINRKINRYL